MFRRFMIGLLAAGGGLVWACSSDHVTGLKSGQGMLAMKLTDAPLSLDSVKEVNVFVERIDARRARTDSSMQNADLDEEHEEMPEHPDSSLWVTIATPGKTFNLLDLQHGVTAFLGSTAVDTGTFRAVRLVIDPSKCTIVLKDGTVLSATSTPPIEFENSHRHGLMVELNDALDVKADATTTLVLDLKLSSSVSLRGTSVHDGFFFRPVIVGQKEGHENGNH